MNTMLRFSAVLLLAAGFVLQAHLRADDKKDPPKEVVVKDELVNADLKDKVRTQMYCKTYTYKMVEGRSYQLDMLEGGNNNGFDPYLRLENANGDQVAADDDSGGFPNARITYRAPKTGDYTIICTTFGAGQTGKYTLIVKDLTGGQNPKVGEKMDKIRRQSSINGSQPAITRASRLELR